MVVLYQRSFTTLWIERIVVDADCSSAASYRELGRLYAVQRGHDAGCAGL